MKASVWTSMAVVVACSGVANAWIFDEDFDNYASQAAFEAVWQPVRPPAPTLVQGTDHTTGFGNSVHSSEVTYENVSVRYFGPNIKGEDVAPIKFEFWMMLEDPTVVGAYRAMNELRGTTGDAYGVGTVECLVAMGAWRGADFEGTPMDGYWNVRTLYGGNGYQALSVPRTAGWHKLTAFIKSNTVQYYVDDVFGGSSAIDQGDGFDMCLLGSGYSSIASDETPYYALTDDVIVFKFPEPTTLLLLAFGSLALRRRRA